MHSTAIPFIVSTMFCQKHLIPLRVQLRYPDQSPLSPSPNLAPKRSLHPALVYVCSLMLTFGLLGGLY